MAITEEVVAIACERAQGARVRRIVMEIGRLSTVLPDAVRFCFDLCAEGTAAEGATLEIREVDGVARCRVCSASVALTQPFGYCVCGNTELDWISGDELKVILMEVY
ncbi:Zn finger protein HypA/HybF [Nannocystis exedens]|nr:Zn finger protein HypA/HybF [Nannocystis exedens]